MKLLTAISLLALTFSAIASGGMFKDLEKFRKACAQGNMKKLQKFEAMGYGPKTPLGPSRSDFDTDLELRDYNIAKFLDYKTYGNVTLKSFNFNKQAKCFELFYEQDALLDINYKYDEVNGGFVQFYNVGLIGNMLIGPDVGSREDETHIMNWARLFVNKYGYNTQNLYQNNRDKVKVCDLSLAVGTRFTLSSIKELVNLGFIHSGDCFTQSLGIAESRGMTGIANYLKSL